MLKNVKVLIQICFIRYNGYIFVHIINNNNLKITKMTTIKNILNPRQRRIILISFAWNPTGQYITDIKDLPQVLKELDPGKGIEFIKECLGIDCFSELCHCTTNFCTLACLLTTQRSCNSITLKYLN